MSDEATLQRGQCPVPDTVVRKLNTRPGFKNGNLEGQTMGTTILSRLRISILRGREESVD